jgi:hypothetical protein
MNEMQVQKIEKMAIYSEIEHTFNGCVVYSRHLGSRCDNNILRFHIQEATGNMQALVCSCIGVMPFNDLV